MVNKYSFSSQGKQALSEHFRVEEFRCKDWSDTIYINTDLITILEKLFSKLGCSSIDIVSGYRTPTHSVEVGGYSTDQHTKGNAADITCYVGGNMIGSKEICCALEDLNHQGGVGRIDNTNVHVDVRGYKCWFDEMNGECLTVSWYDSFGIPRNLKYSVGTYKVTASVLTVREKPDINSKWLHFEELTQNAREQIKQLAGYTFNGYVKNMVCDVFEVSGSWGKTPSGWICLEYTERIK